VTWGTPVQSFVFLGLLVFELEPMYATSDGQTDGRTDGRTTDADHRIMPPRRGHNKSMMICAARHTAPIEIRHDQFAFSQTENLATQLKLT